MRGESRLGVEVPTLRLRVRRRFVLTASIALASALYGLAAAGPAHAVFPGGNGKLAIGFQVFDPPDPAPLPSPGAANGIYNLRWSADGARLAGQVGPLNRAGTSIWVVDEDGQNARSVTAPPGDAYDNDPAWSPDGKEIAFTRTTRGLTCGVNTCSGDALLVVNIETGAIRELLPTVPGQFVYQPDWSPDGRRIAVTFAPYDSQRGVELVDAASGARTALPQLVGFNVSRFSPDGEMIVAGQASLMGGDMRLVRLDGTVLDDIASQAGGGGEEVTFTPDGRWISFRDCRPGCGVWSRRVLGPDDPPGTPRTERLDLSVSLFSGGYLDWQPIPVAVQIVTAPSGTIGAVDAVFTFSLVGLEEPAGEYQCRLEGPQPSDWTACESPHSYGTLPEGDYTFGARFVPEGEDPEDFPETRRSFKVDRTAPSVRIDQAPPASTEARDATVAFSSSHSDGVTFRCRLDGGAEYDCASPQRLASLAVGEHSLSIVARDAVANVSAPVVVRWEVVEPPPEELPEGDPVVEPPPPPPPAGGSGPGTLPLPLPPPPPPAPQPTAADSATCGSAGGTVTIGALVAVSLGECFKPTQIRGRTLNATTAAVKVNGVQFTPRPGTKIVVDGRLSDGIVIWTGPVDASIGAWSVPVPFASGMGVTRAATAARFVPAYLRELQKAAKLSFAGLQFAVEPTFELSKDDGGTTKLGLKLELPGIFQGLPGGNADPKASGGLSFEIVVKAANKKAPSLSARAAVKRAYLFGKLQLEDIALAVDSGPPLTFAGSGKLKLAPYGFKTLGGDANVELKIELGEGGTVAGLRKLSVQASDLQKHVTHGIFLQRLGGEISATLADDGAREWTLSSSAGVSLGPKMPLDPPLDVEAVSLDGAITLKWAKDFSIEAKGTGAIVSVPISESELKVVPANGRAELTGNLDLSIGGYGFRGAISDAFFETAQDEKPRYFQVESSTQLRLGGKLTQFEGKAETVLSEKGYAACYGNDVRIGLAGQWKLEKPKVLAPACDIGPYRSAGATPKTAPGPSARAAQAAGPSFDVAAGAKVKVLALTGAAAAPRVRLLGPGGAVVDATAETPALDDPSVIVVPDDAERVTRIVLRDPAPGRWEIEPAPGAAAPASLQVADELPPVDVKARQLRLSDGRRELSWTLTPIAGQRVSFVERAGDTLRPIATTTRASGRVVYTPAQTAPSARSVEALVTQDGTPRMRDVLIRFRVPRAPLRRVGAIARRGAMLRWRAAPGAAEYAVLLRAQDGTTYSLRTRRPRLRLPLRARRGRVVASIVTVTADGRISQPSTRRLQARKRR